MLGSQFAPQVFLFLTISSMPETSQKKQELRTRLREWRRSLSGEQTSAASEVICQRILSSECYQQASDIAVYLANDGEVDLSLLFLRAQQQSRRLYLPSVESGDLEFLAWPPGTELREGRYGIPVPDGTNAPVDTYALDLILTPLVAFDLQGNRLGMGGGFYDRCIAADKSPHSRRVFLGVAFCGQQQEAVASDAWDQRLQGVVTEEYLQWFD